MFFSARPERLAQRRILRFVASTNNTEQKAEEDTTINQGLNPRLHLKI